MGFTLFGGREALGTQEPVPEKSVVVESEEEGSSWGKKTLFWEPLCNEGSDSDEEDFPFFLRARVPGGWLLIQGNCPTEALEYSGGKMHRPENYQNSRSREVYQRAIFIPDPNC